MPLLLHLSCPNIINLWYQMLKFDVSIKRSHKVTDKTCAIFLTNGKKPVFPMALRVVESYKTSKDGPSSLVSNVALASPMALCFVTDRHQKLQKSMNLVTRFPQITHSTTYPESKREI